MNWWIPPGLAQGSRGALDAAAGAPGPVIWDSGHKDANITLSGSPLLIATDTANATAMVLCTKPVTTNQKVYFEANYTTVLFTASMGFANYNQVLSNQPGADFNPSNGFSIRSATNTVQINQTGTVIFTGVSTDTWSSPGPAIIGCAWDSGANLVWFTLTGTTWNTNVSGTQNPATGQGGVSTASMNAGPMYALAGGWAMGDIVQGIFKTPFTYTVPSGFSAVTP